MHLNLKKTCNKTLNLKKTCIADILYFFYSVLLNFNNGKTAKQVNNALELKENVYQNPGLEDNVYY